jgi:beta-aspartyl-peptidase (threonine type)
MRIQIVPAFFLLAVSSQLIAQDANKGADIRSLLNEQVADWNQKDLDGFMKGYWNSPEVVFLSGGERTNGWQTVRDRYRKAYQTDGKEMGKLVFSEIEIELLSPTAGLARGRWELTKTDGSHPKGWFTLILRRFPDGWRIVHDHTSIATPPKS